MNVAGPNSRSILSTLTDIKLDQESFPYLGVRDGIVAGAPARLLRVGFVGELGYEIHVPSQFGSHVWDQILQAGTQHGLRPFGVEAQRILRLEKGHIIIGQDTDGLTNPFEAGMEWAVKMDKPFFIGQRSLQIIRSKKESIHRTLVGFMLPKDYSGPAPKECHLVIKDGTITGRVTSVTFSATLNRVLGMAYVGRDQSAIGNTFTIRVDGGKEIEAEVVKTPFYDPDGRHQSEPKRGQDSFSAKPPTTVDDLTRKRVLTPFARLPHDEAHCTMSWSTSILSGSRFTAWPRPCISVTRPARRNRPGRWHCAM